MGGDARLMQPLRLLDAQVAAPDHIEPLAEEDLPEYAARVAKAHRIGPSDIIGGASFGGMLAAEIAQQQDVAGLILLGSCLDPRRLPWSYKWVQRVGGFIPDALLQFRSWPPLVRWRFSPISAEAEACLISMVADCPTGQIRHFGRMAIRWRGAKQLKCPAISIHGAQDKIIPLSAADPDIIFENAGHAFTLTHSRETIAEIQRFLRDNSRAN